MSAEPSSISEVPQVAESVQVPPWQKVLTEVQELNGTASNLDLFLYLKRSESLFQSGTEDPGEFFGVMTALCNLSEPIPAPEGDDTLAIRGIRKFKADFAVRNLDIVERYLADAPGESASVVIEAMGKFMSEDYARFSVPMMDFFVKNYTDTGSHLWNKSDFFSYVFHYGVSEQRKWAFDQIKHNLDQPDARTSHKRSAELSYFAGALDYREDPLSEEARDIFTNELHKYGLEADDLLDMWAESKGNRHRSQIIEENIRTIITLEAVRPGIARVLWTDYGIADFGRYPIDLLVWQFDNKDNPDVPYGVMVYPQADHNGAFYQDKQILLGLFVELQDLGYGMRVFEAGSSEDLTRALIISDKRFGAKNKISFAILGGHGAKESIQFGHGKKGFLNMGEVIGRGASSLGRQLPKIKSMFIRNPSIVLFSCTTGVRTGVGHELSVFGARVTGPEDKTHIKSIHVNKNEQDDPVFNIENHWDVKNGIFMRGEALEG